MTTPLRGFSVRTTLPATPNFSDLKNRLRSPAAVDVRHVEVVGVDAAPLARLLRAAPLARHTELLGLEEPVEVAGRDLVEAGRQPVVHVRLDRRLGRGRDRAVLARRDDVARR